MEQLDAEQQALEQKDIDMDASLHMPGDSNDLSTSRTPLYFPQDLARAETQIPVLQAAAFNLLICGCTDANTFAQVIEYLIKKGYSKTEASLRAETQAEAGGDRPQLRNGGENAELYIRAYSELLGQIHAVYVLTLVQVTWGPGSKVPWTFTSPSSDVCFGRSLCTCSCS